ncbi:MAG: glycoside hydrolase family 95-like protein [Pirellulales bacterium]
MNLMVIAVLCSVAAPTGGSGENDLFGPGYISANPATVSRNDVLYVTPSVEPWEAMPVGGGDLSAMVRSDGAGLDLHLTKSDAWGFQAPPDAPLGSRFFNNVSPGHIRLEFGDRARAAAAEQFRQRLDLYRGRIVVRFGRDPHGPQLEIWGHPERKILVVEINDPRGVLEPATIQLSQRRPSMKLSASGTTIQAAEVHQRPAGPHLANTGMEEYFDANSDPLLGRGTAVVLATGSVRPKICSAEAKHATMTLPPQRPPRYYLVIAAAVTTDGDPLAAARRGMDAALAVPLETLKAEQQAWWRDYWSRSLLRIQSPDKTADWLCAAYHVHLYTLACVHRGPMPCKWDGGAGLMRGDERTWGLSEWVQEIRFTYLPLYAANRLEMARGLTRHYSQMRPYLLEQTKRMWGVDGLWIPETVLPWGHAEDFVLEDTGKVRGEHFLPWDPNTAPYGKFERYNGYVGFLFTAGLEICHHYLIYYRYSGDERFLREQGYPMIRDVCRFISGLLRREADGHWHLDPANALETWWMVRDPADTLAGIQAIFPEFIELSEQYEQDPDLRTKCAEILAALPEPSFGHWGRDGTIDAGAKTYAPAAAKGTFPTPKNFEIPTLYRVFPFGLSGIGEPDYELALGTFERRIFGITNSWSLDAIWAARLGLGEEAGKLLVEHADRYNRFRYGGWDSSNSSVFPGGLSVVPYTDGGGLSAFGVNEGLLQSHNGLIRVLPAVPETWSGIFRLRAEGGFLVAADFTQGSVRRAEVQSLMGRRCRIQNPWNETCVVRTGDHVLLRSDDCVVEFDTQAGHVYLLTPAGRPLSDDTPTRIKDTPNQQPGLPGRDNRE